jgi:hypothetical protein
MPTPEDFATYALWGVWATLAFGALAGLAFLLKWGFRFRLVGVTGFTGVLTFGLFALSLTPLTRVSIPGAVHYSLVYDTGATNVVIALPNDVTPTELDATLQQAAGDLFSPGRLARGEQQLNILARTITHPEDGVSQPLYLGQAQRSLLVRDDPNMTITVFTPPRQHTA